MGVLISSNYVLTEMNCNVEAVWSTVSLGSNIDDNNIEGEFSVVSYEVLENHFGKILGIELWNLLAISRFYIFTCFTEKTFSVKISSCKSYKESGQNRIDLKTPSLHEKNGEFGAKEVN